jgi:PPP family 3-phenylpropionic acid transporter
MKKTFGFLNKPIFLSKSIFLLVYGAASVLLPFLALYYSQRGLSGAQIGLLAGIPPVMTMIGASVWGGLADATRRYKLVFLLVISGAIGSVILIPWTPDFVSLSLVIALHAFCFMSLIPLLDNSALEILGQRSEQYGQIRLWGSLGWGVGAPLIGPLVEQGGLVWSFYGHAILMVAGLLIAIPLPVATKSSGSSFGLGLKHLSQDQRWYLFLLVIFIAGFGDALIRNYWFLYLKDLNTSSLLMGLSLTIGMVSELVILFFSGRLLKRLGTQNLLILSVVAQAARLLAWSFISEPYMALSLQVFNGLTFGILWLAGVAYAKEIAPAGLGATAQSVLSGVYFGFASMVGALAGGFLYEQIGVWGMYRWGALVMAIGLLVFILASNLKVKPMTKLPLSLSKQQK